MITCWSHACNSKIDSFKTTESLKNEVMKCWFLNHVQVYCSYYFCHRKICWNTKSSTLVCSFEFSSCLYDWLVESLTGFLFKNAESFRNETPLCWSVVQWLLKQSKIVCFVSKLYVTVIRSGSWMASGVCRCEGRPAGSNLPLSLRPMAGQKWGRRANHEGTGMCQ